MGEIDAVFAEAVIKAFGRYQDFSQGLRSDIDRYEAGETGGMGYDGLVATLLGVQQRVRTALQTDLAARPTVDLLKDLAELSAVKQNRLEAVVHNGSPAAHGHPLQTSSVAPLMDSLMTELSRRFPHAVFAAPRGSSVNEMDGLHHVATSFKKAAQNTSQVPRASVSVAASSSANPAATARSQATPGRLLSGENADRKAR